MENVNHCSELENNFKKELEDLCQKAKKEGVLITPHSNGSWKKFRSLGEQGQASVYNNFSFYYEVCCAAIKDGRNLSDDVSLVWHAIRQLDLRPRSDLFDKLAKGDIIEIYDKSFIQIFRNFNYFEICSYPLADIFMNEWPELYTREQQVTAQLAAQAMDVLSGKVQETVKVIADDHFVEETFSPLGLRMRMAPKYLSPLYDKQKNIAAIVATSVVKIVDSRKSTTDYRPIPTVQDGSAGL